MKDPQKSDEESESESDENHIKKPKERNFCKDIKTQNVGANGGEASSNMDGVQNSSKLDASGFTDLKHVSSYSINSEEAELNTLEHGFSENEIEPLINNVLRRRSSTQTQRRNQTYL